MMIAKIGTVIRMIEIQSMTNPSRMTIVKKTATVPAGPSSKNAIASLTICAPPPTRKTLVNISPPRMIKIVIAVIRIVRCMAS